MTAPKYLRLLGAGLDSQVIRPPGVSERDVNMTLHAVVEAFLDELPRRYPFPGVGKVYLRLGGQPPGGVRSYGPEVGVAEFIWDSFDLTEYLGSDRPRQQAVVLEALERGLLAVAATVGADPAPIRAAATRLRAREFPLPEFSDAELDRRWGLTRSKAPGA